MAIGIIEIHHVNVVVPGDMEEVTKHFYGSVMGLQEIPKPMESQGRGGAWYQLGGVQLHLSVRSEGGEAGRGHICYTVADAAKAEESFSAAGVEIIPDEQPIVGKPRF